MAVSPCRLGMSVITCLAQEVRSRPHGHSVHLLGSFSLAYRKEGLLGNIPGASQPTRMHFYHSCGNASQCLCSWQVTHFTCRILSRDEWQEQLQGTGRVRDSPRCLA